MVEYDWNFQDDDDDDEQPIDPRSLPKQLRTMLKTAKKNERDALDKVKTLEAQNREFAVSQVLESKGVPKKVAKLIPGDVTSPEAIETWLSDYSDLFAPPSSTPANADVTSQGGPADAGQAFIANATAPNGLTPEEIANAQRMQNTASTALPFGGRQEELMAKLNDPNLTEEQFNELLKSG